MYRIIDKEILHDLVVKLVIEAPEIAKNRKPGHFIILRVDQYGERIPLTIVDSDPAKGTITLIVQRVGVTSHKLFRMNPGDVILDVVGPLGKATHIEKKGTVLCAGGGVGIAPLLPIARGFREAGNRVISVLAARSKNMIILEKEMRHVSDEVLIYTDDGTCGKQGLVTHGMEEVIQREKINLSVAIGPAIMMKYASATSARFSIPCLVSLNTIMVDGTGMCGACRVTVGGKTRFVCVDGPEFDASLVDFDEMIIRLGAYKEEEHKAYEKYLNQTEA